MRIYDVEVLDVKMENPEVEKALIGAQRDAISNALTLDAERRKRDFAREAEQIKQDIAKMTAETQKISAGLQTENIALKLELDLKAIEANAKTESERASKALDAEKAHKEIEAVKLEIVAAETAQELEANKKVQALKLEELEAQVQAHVNRAKAISPDLVAALNAFGERAMVERVASAMAPLSILGGDSVADVLKKMLEGTFLAKHLDGAVNGKVADVVAKVAESASQKRP